MNKPNLYAGPIRWFRDLGVRPKVMTAVGLNAAVAVAVGVMGLSSLNSSAGQADSLYRDNVLGVSRLGDLRVDIQEMRIQARGAMLAPEQQDKAAAADKLDAAYAAYGDAAAAYIVT